MSDEIMNGGYNSKLLSTENAVSRIKQQFNTLLCDALSLDHIVGPLFVEENSGLNDNLNDVERCVTFDTKSGMNCSVVQSLAKWKRYYLRKYKNMLNKGIVVDMKAIRRDEVLDALHSYMVDQWDWELVITEADRDLEFLYSIVQKIYGCFRALEEKVSVEYGTKCVLPEQITFIKSQELEDQYPSLKPTQRELEAVKSHGAVFVSQIGKRLRSGSLHDGRAPDYDDWELNGDIIVYYEPLGCPFELSSMGIRVSPQSLLSQLKERGDEDRLGCMYHRMLVNGELPFTIGGGIGQSRLAMFMLKKLHIGEVQCSVWDEKTENECREKGIILL